MVYILVLVLKSTHWATSIEWAPGMMVKPTWYALRQAHNSGTTNLFGKLLGSWRILQGVNGTTNPKKVKSWQKPLNSEVKRMSKACQGEKPQNKKINTQEASSCTGKLAFIQLKNNNFKSAKT